MSRLTPRRSVTLVLALAASLLLAVALPASAGGDHRRGDDHRKDHHRGDDHRRDHHRGHDHRGKGVAFPDRIPLPEGSFPEGIAIGKGPIAYVGSLADGSILRLHLVDGTVEEFASSPGDAQVSVGLDVDRRGRLWVAGGGPAGAPGVIPMVRAYDTASGDLLYEREVDAGFVNDVIVTRKAAWFTDSFNARLIRVPITEHGIGEPEYVDLEGDWVQVADTFNANGIEETRGGRTLIVAQSTNPDGEGAALYTVSASSSATSVEATRIALDDVLPGADGLVLKGRTLYSVVGDPPSVARVRLARDLSTGEVGEPLEVPDAVTPTTAARFGKWLYVVDAQFALGGGPDLSYEIIRIGRWP